MAVTTSPAVLHPSMLPPRRLFKPPRHTRGLLYLAASRPPRACSQPPISTYSLVRQLHCAPAILDTQKAASESQAASAANTAHVGEWSQVIPLANVHIHAHLTAYRQGLVLGTPQSPRRCSSRLKFQIRSTSAMHRLPLGYVCADFLGAHNYETQGAATSPRA